MRKMFKTPHDIMLYRERTEEQELGLAKKGFRLCRTCRAVYFNKSWHHRNTIDIAATKKNRRPRVTKCPACTMIADHQFEGLLIIEDIPRRLETELSRLIKSYCKKAYQKDCQHRLIALDKNRRGVWRVTTTENQLASKLAHKIKGVFNKVTAEVAYSKEPDDVERTTVRFLGNRTH